MGSTSPEAAGAVILSIFGLGDAMAPEGRAEFAMNRLSTVKITNSLILGCAMTSPFTMTAMMWMAVGEKC